MIKALIFKKLTLSLLSSIALVGGIVSLQKPQLDTANQTTIENYKREELKEKFRAKVLKNSPSFGYDNLIADWTYLKFLVYFGNFESREHTGYSVVTDYFQTLVDRDPRFVDAYFFMSPANSLFAGNPKESVNLITQGLKSVDPKTSPKAHFLWTYKAVDELLFLGDSQAAKESYKMAAKWSMNSSSPLRKLTSARMKKMAEFLEDNPDSVYVQIGAWVQVLGNARDNITRQKAVDNIERLGGKITITPEGEVNVTVPEEHLPT